MSHPIKQLPPNSPHRSTIEYSDKAPHNDKSLYKNMGVIYELYTGDMARALQNYVGYISIVGERNAGDVSLWADVVRARISRQGGSTAGQGGGQ